MRIEIVKSKSGYKLISNSSTKHPALQQLGAILMDSNKSSPVKFGVFGVYGGFLDTGVYVYSYISGKKEKMNRRQYYKWLNGDRQISSYVKKENQWKPEELDMDKLLEFK